MSEIHSLGVLALAALVVGWYVRHAVKRVEDAQAAAAESHLRAALAVERCERVLAECRKEREEASRFAGAAWDAAADAEEFAESVEPADDGDGWDEDDD